MSETVNGSSSVKPISKKEVKKELLKKLAGALAEYKGNFSEKKFDGKLKKASKLFAVDIAKSAKKKLHSVSPKKAVKK